MAKKKEEKVYVVKPILGERYHFKFAGSPMYGPLIEFNDKLTQHYGHAWFWFTCDADGPSSCRYPVSIYNISKNAKDV
jgi:hypothetical protein